MFGLRFVCVAVLVVCLGCSVHSEDKDAMRAAIHADIAECMKEFDISEEQAKEVMKTGNTDGVDPCSFACVFKKHQLINDEGLYDVEKAKELVTAHIKNEEILEKVLKIKEECAKVNDEKVSDGDKGCERAVLLFTCFREHHKHDHVSAKRKLGLKRKQEIKEVEDNTN